MIFPLEEVIADIINKNKPTSLNEYRLIQRYKNRHLFLEDVDSETVKELIRFIIEFNSADEETPVEKRQPIIIYINSPGGDVVDGYALIDAIMMSKTPIHTICVGAGYSMGGMIFLAGHKRIMYPKASFMIHEGSTAMIGDATKVKDTMKFYEKLLKISEDFILTKTKIPYEVYEQKKQNDWYLCADECLALGIADEIATTLL